MRQKSNSTPASSETLVRNIRRATRKHHAAEEKIRIVLDGLRGETSIAELCRAKKRHRREHVLLLVEGVLAKNMTMTEVQHARRVGECSSAKLGSADHF